MRALPVSLVLAGLIASSAQDARADVKACVSAHEKGQQQRAAGKLREARETFLQCSTDSCPSAIRSDCLRWGEELVSRIPSVVFGAKDRGGRDVMDVKVTMDGAPLLDKLDGKSITVDPGAHTFKFESPGMPPVTQKLLVKEGDRARAIEVVFEGGEPAKAAGAGTVGDAGAGGAAAAAGGAKKDDTAAPPEKKGPGVLPWVLVGVGGAGVAGGLVYALTAPPLPANCDAASGTCRQVAGQTTADLDAQRNQAGKHDAQGKAGFIIAGAGGVIAIAGLVWYLVASPSSSSAGAKKSAWVMPWVGSGGGGVGAGGTF